MQSAVDHGQRPTAALLESSDPHQGWSSHDWRLQEAVDTLARDKCKSCGNPVWLCHSTHSGIEFDVRVAACYAKAELDDFEKQNPGTASNLESGEFRYAVAVGIKNEDGTRDPLPSRAEALALLKN